MAIKYFIGEAITWHATGITFLPERHHIRERKMSCRFGVLFPFSQTFCLRHSLSCCPPRKPLPPSLLQGQGSTAPTPRGTRLSAAGIAGREVWYVLKYWANLSPRCSKRSPIISGLRRGPGTPQPQPVPHLGPTNIPLLLSTMPSHVSFP